MPPFSKILTKRFGAEKALPFVRTSSEPVSDEGDSMKLSKVKIRQRRSAYTLSFPHSLLTTSTEVSKYHDMIIGILG
jgi:hypothetical protein